ncbi:MAG: cobalamin receptor protein, partial [Cyclobacteriaceae bacterium]|nr:cobalamin receptor protein [Cyclobacteriaceae bacterium HetDA_MAG_MS6]
EEHSYAASVRYHLPSWDFEGYYSRVFQKLGILRGSVTGNLVDLVQAMNNDEPLDTKSFSYSINQPYQETQHDLWKLKGTWATAQQSISFQYAYQANRRQEFDLRRGSAPSINLELFTHTIDMDWAHPEWGNLEGSLGVQWLYQDNNNLPGTNTVPFVPNFNNTRLGIFVVESLESGKTVFELGARWDYQFASTRGRLPNNDLYANKITTSNLTIALGVKREISPGVMFLSNLGTAWRPPDVGELYSFGRHQSRVEYGLWRYDIDEAGNVFNFDTNEREFVLFSEEDRPLKNERGAKWTNSIELEIGDWFLETTGYVNLIWNYYYLRPAGLTNTVRGAFPYFIFDQDDAFFTGIDLTGKLKHTSRMYSTLQASYVYARNISQNEYFVNIPPASLSYRINRQLGFSELELSASYVFRQFNAPRVITPQRILQAALDDEDLFGENNSIFDFQPAPDGYFLIDTAWSGKLGSLGWRLSIRNVLNARYRNYTDQLRYFADDLGRNLSVSLNYSW